MPTSLRADNSETDQGREDLGWLGLAALVTVLLLTVAGFVGIIF
jgi:hypothetical protein